MPILPVPSALLSGTGTVKLFLSPVSPSGTGTPAARIRVASMPDKFKLVCRYTRTHRLSNRIQIKYRGTPILDRQTCCCCCGWPWRCSCGCCFFRILGVSLDVLCCRLCLCLRFSLCLSLAFGSCYIHATQHNGVRVQHCKPLALSLTVCLLLLSPQQQLPGLLLQPLQMM